MSVSHFERYQRIKLNSRYSLVFCLSYEFEHKMAASVIGTDGRDDQFAYGLQHLHSPTSHWSGLQTSSRFF